MDFKNDTINYAKTYLDSKGIENAAQESRWLFEHVYGKLEDISFTDEDIIKNKEKINEVARIANVSKTRLFNKLVMKRGSGEPLQYLLGEWEFYGYPIKVGEGVLIPRPETELLVDIGKKHLAKRIGDIHIVDLCAGSCCVAVAVTKETGCSATAVEISEKALHYAEKNIELNGLRDKITLKSGDIFSEETINSTSEADCIFANPPYLTLEDMKSLQREVNFEPELALYGGEDGLDYYRKIFSAWKKKLKAGGLFAVEVGDKQADMVAELMKDAGFMPKIERDYAKIKRIVYSTI